MHIHILNIALLSLLLASSTFAQSAPAAEFGIKEDQPRLGSNLRKNAVKSPSIPVNLTYEQLSPLQKATVHGNYEKIEEGDEPPFPRDGMKSIFEPLRKAQAKMRVTGDLFLIAKVNQKGEAISVASMGSPDPDMLSFAAKILFITSFKPAVCKGAPCVMDFPLRMSFIVE